jgi:hypothetical protein
MKKIFLFSVLVIVIPSLMFAQLKSGVKPAPSISEELKLPSNGISGLGSLLDPSKFNMSQSYSVMYSNFAGRGNTFGLYTNTIDYRISDPLSLRLHLGYLHQPFMKGLGLDNGFLLGGAELNYKPMDNMLINIQYGNFPIRPYNNNPFYNNRQRNSFDEGNE